MKIDKVTLVIRNNGAVDILIRRSTGCSIGTIEKYYPGYTNLRCARILQFALAYANKVEQEKA